MSETLPKVFLVIYDNGLHYDEHHHYVEKVFASEESAKAYAEQRTEEAKFNPMSREEYYAQQDDEDCTSYEDYLLYEGGVHFMYSDQSWIVAPMDLHP